MEQHWFPYEFRLPFRNARRLLRGESLVRDDETRYLTLIIIASLLIYATMALLLILFGVGIGLLLGMWQLPFAESVEYFTWQFLVAVGLFLPFWLCAVVAVILVNKLRCNSDTATMWWQFANGISLIWFADVARRLFELILYLIVEYLLSNPANGWLIWQIATSVACLLVGRLLVRTIDRSAKKVRQSIILSAAIVVLLIIVWPTIGFRFSSVVRY